MANYYSFEDFVLERKINDKRIKFRSIEALLKAGIELTYFYEDMNKREQFFIGNPWKAFEFDSNSGSLKVSDYARQYAGRDFGNPLDKGYEFSYLTAPELLEEGAVYSESAQNYALSVLLFQFFFHALSPYQGMDSANQVFLNRMVYGFQCV